MSTWRRGRRRSDTGFVGPRRGTETLHLVEDEAEVRSVVRESLTLSGYAVLEAHDVVRALELAIRWPGPNDLLITDVVMPRMNGRELAERLRVLHPEAKVLYVSGYTDHVIGDEGVLAPGTAFLAKPFTPGNLAAKVRSVLGIAGGAW